MAVPCLSSLYPFPTYGTPKPDISLHMAYSDLTSLHMVLPDLTSHSIYVHMALPNLTTPLHYDRYRKASSLT